MNQKIRCESCNKVIAEGQKPATVIINCPHCGARNDLNNATSTQPFYKRLRYERKVFNNYEDGTCIIQVMGSPE